MDLVICIPPLMSKKTRHRGNPRLFDLTFAKGGSYLDIDNLSQSWITVGAGEIGEFNASKNRLEIIPTVRKPSQYYYTKQTGQLENLSYGSMRMILRAAHLEITQAFPVVRCL